MRRKAFTLIELLIALLMLSVIMVGIAMFFDRSAKNAFTVQSQQRANMQLMHVVELIDDDLVKAGYGGVAASGLAPVEWDATTKTLTIRYVNYDDPSCVNVSWGSSASCDWTVQYALISNNLDRSVNGGTFEALFDPAVAKVLNFNATVNTSNTRPVVNFEITVQVESFNGTPKIEKLGDQVVIMNW